MTIPHMSIDPAKGSFGLTRIILLRILALALVYMMMGKVAVTFATVQGNVSILWPSSGVALAALLLFGRELWPGVFLGALVTSLWIIGNPPITTAAIAIGNTLDVLVGVWLLQHTGFDARLQRLRDYYLLFFLAGIIATLVSALLGVGSLTLAGLVSPAMFPSSAMHWWMGNVLGTVMVAPILLIWKIPGERITFSPRLLESIGMLTLAWYCGTVIFIGAKFAIPFKPMLFWVVPFFVWAALRFGRHGITVLLTMYFAQSLLGAATGTGFFSSDFKDSNLLNFWFFHMVGNLAAMTLAIALHERNTAGEGIRQMAQHDFLTGLPNRLLFNDRFAQLLAAARRNRTRFVLFYIDLDGFKQINDTLGHHEGDLLLKDVAQRLTDTMRATDTICRIGGDEFVILMPDFESADHMEWLAAKILDTVRQPYAIDGHEITITASIGSAVYPIHGETMDAMLKAADRAMYRSKNEGGNRLSSA
jgi:diguanylate cyclase (GGDEF)-like protein